MFVVETGEGRTPRLACRMAGTGKWRTCLGRVFRSQWDTRGLLLSGVAMAKQKYDSEPGKTPVEALPIRNGAFASRLITPRAVPQGPLPTLVLHTGGHSSSSTRVLMSTLGLFWDAVLRVLTRDPSLHPNFSGRGVGTLLDIPSSIPLSTPLWRGVSSQEAASSDPSASPLTIST